MRFTVSENVNAKWEVRSSADLKTPARSYNVVPAISDDGNYFLLRKYTNVAEDTAIAVYLSDGTLLKAYSWQDVSTIAAVQNGTAPQVSLTLTGVKVNDTVLPLFDSATLDGVSKFFDDKTAEAEVRAAITELGSDDPDAREAAMEKLRYATIKHEKLIDEAVQSGPSTEIQLRARAIMQSTASQRKLVGIFHSNPDVLSETAKNWKDQQSLNRVNEIAARVGSLEK